MGTPSSPSASSVRLSRAAAQAFRGLPRDSAAEVAEAIRRVGTDRGKPLRIPAGRGMDSYTAIEPAGDESPVVIYRELSPSEGGGYLVTAIVDRGEYDGYRRAERQGALDTPLARLLLSAASGEPPAP